MLELDGTVLTSLNEALYGQANKWADEGKHPSSLAVLDIDDVIMNTNPRLWNMVRMLTQPKHHRGKDNTNELKTRRLPCLFILAAMAHATYPPCHYPFHLVLSDYTESQSGSADLLQILSRLGICSSRDTLQRLKTAVVSQRREEGMQKEVSTGAFSITSIDNIDRAAPGKRITPSNQGRGFHGTSVQHVAPKPVTCTLSKDEVPAEPRCSVPRAGLFSPTMSAQNVCISTHPRTLREGQKKQQRQSHQHSKQ